MKRRTYPCHAYESARSGGIRGRILTDGKQVTPIHVCLHLQRSRCHLGKHLRPRGAPEAANA